MLILSKLKQMPFAQKIYKTIYIFADNILKLNTFIRRQGDFWYLDSKKKKPWKCFLY